MLFINDYMVAFFNKNVKNAFGILNRDYDNKGNFLKNVNSNFHY